MDFAALPPEINSGRMYAGAGAGPMLAAATSWEALAAELHIAAAGYDTAIGDLAIAWTGPSASAMAAAASPYAAWMHASASRAEQAAGQARAAAAAYQLAFAMTVPPAAVAANRSQLLALLASNFFGQNTAAIAATEAHYAEMWAQDATAMYHYAGSAAVAAALKPFDAPPGIAGPAGAANQAALASQTAQPAMASAVAGLAVTLLGSIVVDSIGTFGIDALGTFVIDVGGVAIGALEANALPLAGLAGWTSPVGAGMGQAATLGALSVPRAWATATPGTIRLTGTALPSAGAGPGLAAMPAAPMLSAGLAGAAAAAAGQPGRGTTAAPAAGKRAGPAATSDVAAKPVPHGPVTAMSAKLRRLAKLREAGILSDERFVEKKRRLLDQRSTS